MSGTLADRLYSYVLPGKVASPLPGISQAQEAERIGLGGIFLSERWESKELGATIGALAMKTERLMLVAGLTHFGTRHPLAIAGLAQTMQLLSDNRFVLGFGRGVPPFFKKMGIPVLNNAGMADYADILRKLWAGETVRYSGPAGEFPEMQLQPLADRPPPLLMGTIGPKTLAMAGAHFDGVVLHPFLTPDGVERSIATVRAAAEKAGRDPQAISIYTTVVTAPDTLSEAQRIDIRDARAVSYFMHESIGKMLVQTNGWDEAPLARMAEADLGRLEYAGDPAEARRMMAEAASLLPDEWLETGAVSGSVDKCVARIKDYVDAGSTHILLHGTTPDMQGELVAAMRETRC